MRRTTTIAIVAIAMMVGGGAQAGVSSEKVVGGPGEQYWASANDEHVAFAEYRRRRYDVYISQLDGSGRVRVNANDRGATLGTLMAGTDVVLLQQFRQNRSDLYFYDISTKRRWLVPPPVRSAHWEYWPAGSQAYILFMRFYRTGDGRRSLMLYDRVADDVQVLIDDVRRKTVFPSFAGARYVAWTICGAQKCSIEVLDTDAGTTTELPQPRGKSRYAPSIDEASSTIYFVESASDVCGRNVTIRSATLGVDGSTVLASLPRRIDTGWTLGLAPNTATGFDDLYFERWDCRRQAGDVHRLVSVDGPPPASADRPGDRGGSGLGERPTMPGAPPGSS